MVYLFPFPRLIIFFLCISVMSSHASDAQRLPAVPLRPIQAAGGEASGTVLASYAATRRPSQGAGMLRRHIPKNRGKREVKRIIE
jgi:hypothetical protein